MLSDPLFRHLRPEPSIFGNQSREAVTTGRAHGNLLSSDHFQISNGSANTWLLIIICIILPSWQTVSHFAVLYPIQSHYCMPCTYLQGILIRSCKGRFPFTESALLFILQSQKQFGQVFRILHLVPSILHAIEKRVRKWYRVCSRWFPKQKGDVSGTPQTPDSSNPCQYSLSLYLGGDFHVRSRISRLRKDWVIVFH